MIFGTIMGSILEFFFENSKWVHLRELSKKLGLSTFSTKKYLDILVKEKILVERREGNMIEPY